nr:hypothetical protein [Geodermatophilus chilensis]
MAHDPGGGRQRLVDVGLAEQAGGDPGAEPVGDGDDLLLCLTGALSHQQRDPFSCVEHVGALVDNLKDDEAVAATVRDEGDKGCVSDGRETDADRLSVTDGEYNAIHCRLSDGSRQTVHDPRLLWPDTTSVAVDRHHVTANQLYQRTSTAG